MAAPWGGPALGGRHGGAGAAGLGLVAVWPQPHGPGVWTWCRAPWEPRAAAAFLPPPLLLLRLPPHCSSQQPQGWSSREGSIHRRSCSWAVLESERSISRGTAVAKEPLGLYCGTGLGLC